MSKDKMNYEQRIEEILEKYENKDIFSRLTKHGKKERVKELTALLKEVLEENIQAMEEALELEEYTDPNKRLADMSKEEVVDLFAHRHYNQAIKEIKTRIQNWKEQNHAE